MKHSVIPTVNVYFVRDNTVLLGRRVNTGYMDGYLCPPGGHIEKGETPTQAIVREIQEELGITVPTDVLEFMCVSARLSLGNEIVAYQFVVRDQSFEPINNEPHKCTELVWSPLGDLPEDLVVDFRQIIDGALVGDKRYLEVGY